MDNWLYAGLFAMPLIYLILHGWANERLLDTRVFDRLAVIMFVCSAVGCMSFYLKSEDRESYVVVSKHWYACQAHHYKVHRH